MRTNTDLTLYSRSIVNGDAAYTRSVITEVHWEARKAANTIASGLIDADSAVVYIPTYGRTTPVTIFEGDVLVKGQVADVVGAGFTMTQLRAKYPSAIVVRSVDPYDYGSPALQHVKVSGR